MNSNAVRNIALFVAALNLSYFFVEIGVALAIKSVSLFADSIDFLEDTSINFLIALALGWSAVNRTRMGMVLAGILLVPGVAALWEAWQKLLAPVPLAAALLSITGAGGFVVNLFCVSALAVSLAQWQSHARSVSLRA